MSDLIIGWPHNGEPPRRKTWKSIKRNSDLAKAEKYVHEGHLVTFAPTGTGKGVKVIIPNLLHYDGPVITIDPKGENFAITARYRRDVLGQRIFLLDPFNFVKEDTLHDLGIERAFLNPLDLVGAYGTDIEIQLMMTASLLTLQTNGAKRNDFWENEARSLIAGVLGIVIYEAKVNNTNPEFDNFIDLLYSDDVIYNLAVKMDRVGEELPKMAHKAIAAYLQKASKEQSGVLSTAHNFLNVFTSKALTHYLNSSTITPKDLSEKIDYTIYVVIPPTKLISHSILLKLWVSTMLNTVMEREYTPLKKTLFLLDECAQLGSLDVLKQAITLMRGYGLQVWMFFQDVAQIKELYPQDYLTLINNCGVFQTFGIPRTSSATPIIEIIGKFEEDELLRLDRTQQVISISYQQPKVIRLCNYLTDPAFDGLYDENPLYKIKNSTREKAILPFPMNHLKINI